MNILMLKDRNPRGEVRNSKNNLIFKIETKIGKIRGKHGVIPSTLST